MNLPVDPGAANLYYSNVTTRSGPKTPDHRFHPKLMNGPYFTARAKACPLSRIRASLEPNAGADECDPARAPGAADYLEAEKVNDICRRGASRRGCSGLIPGSTPRPDQGWKDRKLDASGVCPMSPHRHRQPPLRPTLLRRNNRPAMQRTNSSSGARWLPSSRRWCSR
jgi:hypothetical protein